MKKLLSVTLLFLTTNLFATTGYTGKVDKNEILKYKEKYIEYSKIKDPQKIKEINKNFDNLINSIVNNNYKAPDKKTKEKILGFLMFSRTLIDKNIDEYTTLKEFKYLENKDELVMKKIIHDLNKGKYKKIFEKVKNKQIFLKMISKILLDFSKINFCTKNKKNPFPYAIINSGTKIKEEIYYKDKNNKTKFIYSETYGKSTCKEIGSEPKKWLLNRKEFKEFIKYIKN